MRFVSSRATVKGQLEDDVVIFGSSIIGAGTLIGRNVTIGYPSKVKIKSLISSRLFDIKECDLVSEGAKIGRNCIIRSGSIIYELVVLGDEVETGHNVLIREGSSIGEGSLIGSFTILDGKVTIGKNVSIQSNVYLPHLTIIKDEVFIAPNVCFTNDPYPRSSKLTGTVVERESIICANSTILPGLKIGEKAVIAAGSIVTRDVPPGSVVAGNPARFMMNREDFERKRKMWEESGYLG